MSTHNICFRGEVRKVFTGYPILTGLMNLTSYHAYPKKCTSPLDYLLMCLKPAEMLANRIDPDQTFCGV